MICCRKGWRYVWFWSAACSDGGVFPAWGLWLAEQGRIRWIGAAIISKFGNEVGSKNTAGAVCLQLESISVNLKWPTSAELAFSLKLSHMRLSCKHIPMWKWVFTPSLCLVFCLLTCSRFVLTLNTDPQPQQKQYIMRCTASLSPHAVL